MCQSERERKKWRLIENEGESGGRQKAAAGKERSDIRREPNCAAT